MEAASAGYWRFWKKGHEENLDFDTYYDELNEPEFSRELVRLNRTLVRYPMTLTASMLPEKKKDKTGLTWENSWGPYRQSKSLRGSEGRFLQIIMYLASEGRLAAIRQCENCRKWICARRIEKDRFCSNDCRIQFNRDTPAQREARREWSRKNYRSRIELESGSRAAAQKRKRGKK